MNVGCVDTLALLLFETEARTKTPVAIMPRIHLYANSGDMLYVILVLALNSKNNNYLNRL